MRGYFYRGRHRRETYAGRKVATLAVSGALGFGLTQGSASAAGADWGPIIACESGGNPTAQNASSSASGLFQFLDSTWRAYGGAEFAARAKFATVAEQYIVADRAYAREGLRPWTASKSCWQGRAGAGASAQVRVSTPQTTPTRGRAAASAPAVVEASAEVHVVVDGDTLSGIALAAHVAGGWPALYERNRDTVGGNPHLIFPGQQLNL